MLQRERVPTWLRGRMFADLDFTSQTGPLGFNAPLASVPLRSHRSPVKLASMHRKNGVLRTPLGVCVEWAEQPNYLHVEERNRCK